MMNRQFILLVKYARHLILMGCFLKKEDGQLHNKLKKIKNRTCKMSGEITIE